MKRWMVVPVLVVLGCVSGSARGDGILVVPSRLLKVFTEQTQVAVVEVRPDATARVDLFISLLDTSGESHEVPFLLPLQTMPEEFRVQEVTLAKFQESRTDPLNRVLDRAAAAKRSDTPLAMYAGCSLLCGPWAVIGCAGAVILFPVLAKGRAGLGGRAVTGPSPSLSVATEHARADVYRALRRDELAALVRVSALPEAVAETLDKYAGRPFALVRLRTSPVATGDAAYGRVAPEEHPGIHLEFTQEMLSRDGNHRYDYPLGTGQGWEHPIPLTRVYVTGRDDLRLEVDFPEPHRYPMADAWGGRQVHVASYHHANPGEDVKIGLRGRGVTSLMIREWWGQARVATGWIGFPLLALFAWFLAFRVTLWQEPYAKQLGLWRALWRSWVAGVILRLCPLFLLVGLVWMLVRPGLIPAGLLAVGVPGAVYVAVIYRSPEWRDLLRRSGATSAIAAVMYFFFGLVLLVALGGFTK